MTATTFKLAPLSLLLWAIWPQAAMSSEEGILLVRQGEGEVQQTAALPLMEEASKNIPNEAPIVLASAQAEDSVNPAGKEEAGAPSAPLPMQMPPAVPMPIPFPGFPSPQMMAVPGPMQAARQAYPQYLIPVPQPAMPNPVNMGRMPVGPMPSFVPPGIPMMQQGWRQSISMPTPAIPSLPQFPMFPVMPWLAPQMTIPARAALPQFPMPALPMAMPFPGFPGMMPNALPALASPAISNINRMQNSMGGGFPAAWVNPQIHPLATPYPMPNGMAGSPAPWGVPQMPLRVSPGQIQPVMAGFPQSWKLPRFPMPIQGNWMPSAMAMAPVQAPMGVPAGVFRMPLPFQPPVAGMPNFWNGAGINRQPVPLPIPSPINSTAQTWPQARIAGPVQAPAIWVNPAWLNAMQSQVSPAASTPSQPQMATAPVNEPPQSAKPEVVSEAVQNDQNSIRESVESMKEIQLSTAGAPAKPLVEPSIIPPVVEAAAKEAIKDAGAELPKTRSIGQVPEQPMEPVQSAKPVFPLPPVVGEAAFPAVMSNSKQSVPQFQSAKPDETSDNGTEQNGMPATRKVKGIDPCSENFRPVRSKVKRPKGRILKTRKPAYDPCKGRYKTIKAKMS